MIYDKFFKFREEPFGVTPDPKFLYMSRQHEYALASLNFGMKENRGFVMLTGEVGSGKTTLIRYLLDNLGSDIHTSLIINPMVEPLELLKLTNHDFGVECSSDTKKAQMDALNNFLLECYSKNEKAILVIDEAQELSHECLEFIRLLSNLETNTAKLLQVVLVGQPELRNIVSGESLKQLDQRIAVRYHLQPLDFDETVRYINHRLNIAGGGLIKFPEQGVRFIYKYSHGIPRLINLACDRTLLHSYSESDLDIKTKTIKQSLKELEKPRTAEDKSSSSFIRAVILPALFGIVIAIIAVMTLYNNMSNDDTVLFSKKTDDIGIVRRFFIKDGIYMVADRSLIEETCVLNLLGIWGEKTLPDEGNAFKEAAKRGLSVYKLGNNFDMALKLNLPAIFYAGDKNSKECIVVKSIKKGNTFVINPMKGESIIPADELKSRAANIIVLYKNNFSAKISPKTRISLLQEELKKMGLYEYYIDGIFGKRTKKALAEFQQANNIAVTGKLDENTVILLSRNENTPKLVEE